MVPDVNGLAQLDPARLKASWIEEVADIERHYDFNPDQRSKADAELRDYLAFADIWFQDPATTQKRNEYVRKLGEVQAVERNWRAIAFERERAWSGAERWTRSVGNCSSH